MTHRDPQGDIPRSTTGADGEPDALGTMRAWYERPEVAARYVGFQRGTHRLYGRRVREQRLVARLLEETPPSARILDLPCGTGRYFPLTARFCVTVGADISQAMLGGIQPAVPGIATASPLSAVGAPPLVCADAMNLPFPDEAFDLVLCMRLLHHLGTPELLHRCLRELHRVTREALVCSFFNTRSVQHLRRRFKEGLGARRSARHALSFAEMRAALDLAGFEVARLVQVRPWWSETCVLRCRKRP